MVKISVGTSWKDSKGRTWEVVERLPFGKARIRTTDLRCVGEMYERDIRRILETKNGQATQNGNNS
jgi:hypothetical protein